MNRRAHPPAITALSIALGGVAMTGGCALIYGFDYTSESSMSGSGGSSSSAQSTASGSTGTSGSGHGPSSSSSGSTGAGGGLPAVAWAYRAGGTGADQVGHPGIAIGPKPDEDVFIAGVFRNTIDLGDI